MISFKGRKHWEKRKKCTYKRGDRGSNQDLRRMSGGGESIFRKREGCKAKNNQRGEATGRKNQGK